VRASKGFIWLRIRFYGRDISDWMSDYQQHHLVFALCNWCFVLESIKYVKFRERRIFFHRRRVGRSVSLPQCSVKLFVLISF
jgi:hypothetical protein